MAKRERRKFDDTFKRDAVELSCSPGITQKRVCEQLNISPSLLYRWRCELLDPDDAPIKSVDVGALRKELRKQEAQLIEKDREIAFLKKASAYFAQHSNSEPR